ncbi:nuclear apoptosis-inducing factor 1-like [Heterodontus francisci]|uniref:nuclear apoptosis-inducing factor 1-like n=1 Tax=Heterodontus francisci TaxID=7792 RepID=UPI00355C02E8
MEGRRFTTAPRFSEESLQVLLQVLEARRDILFNANGQRRPAEVTKGAWLEVAKEVSCCCVVWRTWLQCHKRLNDLLRSARVRGNARERSRTSGGQGNQAYLTTMEEDALMLGRGGQRKCHGRYKGHVFQSVVLIKLINLIFPPGETHQWPGGVPGAQQSPSEDGEIASESAPSHHRTSPSASAETSTMVGITVSAETMPLTGVSTAQSLDQPPEAEPADASHTRRSVGGQASAEPQADDAHQRTSSRRDMLQVQLAVHEHLAELPETLRATAHTLETSIRGMSAANSQAFVHLAFSIDRLMAAMEGPVLEAICNLGGV